MKKTLVTLFLVIVLGSFLASCSSHHCDAYKTSHSYTREIIH